jgi:hypothetical protein
MTTSRGREFWRVLLAAVELMLWPARLVLTTAAYYCGVHDD